MYYTNEYFKNKKLMCGILKIKNTKTNITYRILFDLDDYKKIRQFHWHITDEGYVRTSSKKTNPKCIKLHQFVFPKRVKLIDHKNRNKLDCRKCNLIESNYLLNNRNKSKSRKNKSGRTGVYERNKSGNLYYVAEWADNKKKYQKWFSQNKYGKENAFNLAVKTREEAEKELKIYTEK